MAPLPAAVPTGAAARTAPPFPAPSPLPSFWLASLSPADLAPVSPSLPPRADFVVIGGGLTGASAAYHLAKALREAGDARTVALVEARELSGGATGRNGGICVAGKEYSWKIAGDLAQGKKLDTEHLRVKTSWELANARVLAEFHDGFRKRNPGCPVFFERWPEGCIELWTTDEEAKSGKEVHELMEKAGLRTGDDGEPRWEVWSAEHAENKTGVKGVKGAVVYKTAFRAWGAKYVNAVASGAAALGASIHTHTLVRSVARSPAGPDLWTIETDKGNLTTNHVIFATNGYTRSLLPWIPVTPLRGQILLTKPLAAPLPFDAEISINYGWLYGGTRADGRFCVGGRRDVLEGNGHLLHEDSVLDGVVSEALAKDVDAFGVKWEKEAEWTGIQGWTPERYPVIGPVPGEDWGFGGEGGGRWIAAGFCGHGMPQVFLAGRCVANLALGKGYDDIVPEYMRSEGRVEAWKQLG
ncbi:FAD dependent oxidoreductase [Hyaloraphidium curvatum]|nr:FAD dependent oxidoreductase [Hyaloraphidium curvatum]